MSDMQFNHAVHTIPPAIPEKSSKQLIFGILLVMCLLGLAAYGFHAGIFTPDPAATSVVPD
jgi:hypothetical protein